MKPFELRYFPTLPNNDDSPPTTGVVALSTEEAADNDDDDDNEEDDDDDEEGQDKCAIDTESAALGIDAEAFEAFALKGALDEDEPLQLLLVASSTAASHDFNAAESAAP